MAGRADGADTRSLGRDFGWLWAAYGISAFGTRFAFDAFALIAILALGAGPAQVALLSAAGLAVGAAVAVPLGPWVEFRRKRPVMVAMDLTRCAALVTVPVAYALDALTFAHLLAVSVLVAAADIAFSTASGAHLKALVHPEDLLTANGRMESTTWTATALGPPLGGATVGVFGPVVTVAADAVSYLLSAAGIRAIRATEPHPQRSTPPRLRVRDLTDGWRFLLTDPALRPLFLNTVLVSALIMAAAPPLAVLMLGQLGFAPWQYGLAFALPCLGGLIGSRLSRPLVHRFGERAVLRVAGTLRVCWPLALAFVHPGPTGLALVMVTELGLITCMGVFNPVYATYRLHHTPPDRIARTLSAWTITTRATVAALTALSGLLATLTSPRTAIATAGLLILATPFLLRFPGPPGGLPGRKRPYPLGAPPPVHNR
ncbi:MFS transporter [Streptomyces flavofungini]|uniref:MFS transporter n=1 Tax=Streptomyces flavofungini TaxID=68200 RepID=A0ABS0X5F1_9ACTN|nr:MFS transporter [Streptomyces flavofungini]MBJ3808424.1 MFS transporter [Streptomyces flavofungini]GHC69495.1 MFS transporter [Streptomyces flavofungini]